MSEQTLKLTREQRAQLFRRDPPKIRGDAPCPVEAGYRQQLSANVWLVVSGVKRFKGGKWELVLVVDDRRDPPRLLRRAPHAQDFDEIRRSFDAYGYAAEPTADVLRQAAEESAYTSATKGSLADAGEAVDQATQGRYSAEARMRLREARRDEETKRDVRRRLERLRAASMTAERLEIGGAELAAIDGQIAALERLLAKAP